MPALSRLGLPSRILLLSLAVALLAATAASDPTPGFREEWPGVSLQGWGGGNEYSNPGTGGVLGDRDGFLLVSNVSPLVQARLGAFSPGAEYSGDWRAAGVTQVRVWLNDVNANDALEIHFGIGISFTNFWQYNVGFVPPEQSWAGFVVDLTSGSNWTQLFGPGTFEDAVLGAAQILIRHDFAPYTQFPDTLRADVGMDHLLLTNGIVGVEPTGPSVVRPLQLAPPFPNPSRGPVSVAFESLDASPVTIQILDVTGRMVRHAELAAGTGPRVWMWDGSDDRGRLVAPGAYRVRALGASGGMSRPIIRAR